MQRRHVLGSTIAFLGAIGSFKAANARGTLSQTVTCGESKGPAPQQHLQTAKRMPKMPDRSTISKEELPAYDQIAARVQPGDQSHMVAFAVAPRTGGAISGLGRLGDT